MKTKTPHEKQGLLQKQRPSTEILFRDCTSFLKINTELNKQWGTNTLSAQPETVHKWQSHQTSKKS